MKQDVITNDQNSSEKISIGNLFMAEKPIWPPKILETVPLLLMLVDYIASNELKDEVLK